MDVSEPWLDCLLEEYFNQSDREKAEGLPVAPFMDREKVTKPTAQIGFIKFVLLPLFEAVSRMFPQLDSTMVESLRQAQRHYEKMKQEDDVKVPFHAFRIPSRDPVLGEKTTLYHIFSFFAESARR